MSEKARRLSPQALWRQAKENGEEYVRLLRQHGHIVDRQKDTEGNLIYTPEEMAELVLLAQVRFQSDYLAAHGRLPENALVIDAIKDAMKGKVIAP